MMSKAQKIAGVLKSWTDFSESMVLKSRSKMVQIYQSHNPNHSFQFFRSVIHLVDYFTNETILDSEINTGISKITDGISGLINQANSNNFGEVSTLLGPELSINELALAIFIVEACGCLLHTDTKIEHIVVVKRALRQACQNQYPEYLQDAFSALYPMAIYMKNVNNLYQLNSNVVLLA